MKTAEYAEEPRQNRKRLYMESTCSRGHLEPPQTLACSASSAVWGPGLDSKKVKGQAKKEDAEYAEELLKRLVMVV